MLDRNVRRVTIVLLVLIAVYAVVLVVWFGESRFPNYVPRKSLAMIKERPGDMMLLRHTHWARLLADSGVPKPVQLMKQRSHRWQGTIVHGPNPVNVSDSVSNRIRELFEEKESVAKGRRECFLEYANLGSKYHPIEITGWYISIQEIRPADDGYLVEIRVGPRLAGGGSITACGQCTETWRLEGDELTFVKRAEERVQFVLIID